MNKPNHTPTGYRVQSYLECCANCMFGGYIGTSNDEPSRMCICEIMGECKDGDYGAIAVDPLGVCDAVKLRCQPLFRDKEFIQLAEEHSQ